MGNGVSTTTYAYDNNASLTSAGNRTATTTYTCDYAIVSPPASLASKVSSRTAAVTATSSKNRRPRCTASWARTARTVEVFHRGKRVAAHVRSSSNRKHTTVREHMPSSHRRYADWTPERITRQAGEIGRNTSALVEIILRERTHPEQGFRACVGILRLVKTYGRERLEAACSRALEIGARSYSSVNSILKNNLDRQRPAKPADGPAIAHDNIRGPTYFH
jgi:transposase